LIGFFEDRLGTAAKVERLVGDALRQDLPLLMSAVNWGGVLYTAWWRHGEAQARQAEAWLVTAEPEFSRLGKALQLYALPRHER
jgi:hypothetical protein